MSFLLLVLSAGLCTFPSYVLAHGGSSDSMAGKMLSYLHFTSGDNLLFLGWVPTSAGSMAGTCIGLFLLGIIERWIAVCAAIMSKHWDKRFAPSIIDAD